MVCGWCGFSSYAGLIGGIAFNMFGLLAGYMVVFCTALLTLLLFCFWIVFWLVALLLDLLWQCLRVSVCFGFLLWRFWV